MYVIVDGRRLQAIASMTGRFELQISPKRLIILQTSDRVVCIYVLNKFSMIQTAFEHDFGFRRYFAQFASNFADIGSRKDN